MRAHIAVVSLLWASIAAAQPPTPVTQAVISSKAPLEVMDGDGHDLPVAVGNLPLDFFDNYSWRLFVALNWPAKDGVRGEPDTMKSIGDAGPRVWETWKAAYETIPKSAKAEDAPKPWTSFDGPTPCSELDVPTAGSGKQRIIGVWKPFGDFNQGGFGTFDESNPLICQNKTYVRYEARVNQAEYEHIVAKKLYLRSTISGLTAPERFPRNSIEVKAAWRELEDGMPDAEVKTFYSIKALVHNAATGACDEKRLGLVGFHIVQKTPLRPQWTWSSFEHVRNVPEIGTTPAGKYSFNDPAKPQATGSGPPAITLGNPPNAAPSPVQVVRELPLHPAANGNVGTQQMNERYRAKLTGTVWENYKLVVTQWPTRTSTPSATPPDNFIGDPFPSDFGSSTSVANTALESYHQSASCMACHDSSRAINLDFVFFLDFHAFNDTAFDGAKPRSLDLLREAIAKSRRRSSR